MQDLKILLLLYGDIQTGSAKLKYPVCLKIEARVVKNRNWQKNWVACCMIKGRRMYSAAVYFMDTDFNLNLLSPDAAFNLIISRTGVNFMNFLYLVYKISINPFFLLGVAVMHYDSVFLVNKHIKNINST